MLRITRKSLAPVVLLLVFSVTQAIAGGYAVVDVSAVTGQKVVGPVTSWQTPSGNGTAEHLAGINTNGDLIVFYFLPGSNWKTVNLSQMTGQKVIGPLTSWQNKAGGTNVEHLAGRTEDGDLIVFYFTTAADWKAVNASQMTGQKAAGPPTSWEVAGWNHIACEGPGNSLVQFFGTAPDKWQSANITGSTNQQIMGGLASWSQKVADVWIECVSGMSPNGDAIAFYYTPGSGWKVVNITQMTGKKIASPPKYWLAGSYNHLAAQGPDGSLVQFFGTVVTKWQASNITDLTGEKMSGVPTAYLGLGVQTKGIVPIPTTDEVVGARGPDGSLLMYWWTPEFDWQVMNLTQATGKTIVSAPEGWTVKGNQELVEHMAAEGEDNTLLVFWGNTEPRRMTDSLQRPFASLKRHRNEQGKMLAILWDPHRADNPAPTRAAVETTFTGKTDSIRDYFTENSGGYFTVDTVAVLPKNGGWYNAKEPASYYWQKMDGSQKLNAGWVSPHVEKWAEAVRAADPDFDYAKYDLNRDGVLTANELRICVVIPQEIAYGSASSTVGKQSPPEDLKVDGVKIPEIFEVYIGNPPDMPLVAHEAAHSFLDAGDMYAQYSGTDGIREFFQPYSPRAYSLMDSTTGAHLDPFHKLKYGWLRPRVVYRTGIYSIPDVVNSHVVYILMDPKRGTDEYFIVENRSGVGYNNGLFSKGLAVWQIIEKGYGKLGPPPNTESQIWTTVGPENWGRRAVRLIRPHLGPSSISLDSDALWRLETGFDLTCTDSDPNHGSLRWSDGTSSGFNLRQMTISSETMFVRIEVP